MKQEIKQDQYPRLSLNLKTSEVILQATQCVATHTTSYILVIVSYMKDIPKSESGCTELPSAVPRSFQIGEPVGELLAGETSTLFPLTQGGT